MLACCDPLLRLSCLAIAVPAIVVPIAVPAAVLAVVVPAFVILCHASLGTQTIATACLQIDNQNVTLIDTPSFDDTERTDVDILKLIADYLAHNYHHGVLLTGVILLQPINANRVQGSERKHTRLFEKACGKDACRNVVIATTMWSDLECESVGMDRMRKRMREVMF